MRTRPRQPIAPAPRQADAVEALDPWLEHEAAVARLANIVLLASALAERPVTSAPGSLVRRERLQDGTELARCALLAAARLGIPLAP